ncbi:MAG: dihydrofolate reductase [Myxococcota bacterium]|jgi:dihydrofolate reductase
MKISLVAALASNRVIGRDGALPWKLPDDLRRFRTLTTGHCVVMGRQTFESVGRPLPKRTNIVLSRRGDWNPEGVWVAGGIDSVLSYARANDEEQLFVIGGAAVYALFLERADTLHLTRVEAEIAGDTTFPDFDESDGEASDWRLSLSEHHVADAQHEYAFRFEQWQRSRSQPR